MTCEPEKEWEWERRPGKMGVGGPVSPMFHAVAKYLYANVSTIRVTCEPA